MVKRSIGGNKHILMLKKNIILTVGSVILLSLLTVLLSSPVQALGSYLEDTDMSFGVSKGKVLIVTNTDLGEDKKILGTNKYLQNTILPENIIQLSGTQEHLLNIEISDSQGRLDNDPKIAIRIGLVYPTCDTSTLNNADDPCWIHPGVTESTNGYNPDNLLSIGNGKCKCTDTDTSDGCNNMTCYTNTTIPGAKLSKPNFDIVGLISTQKYCTLDTQCHNNGNPTTSDEGYREYCNNDNLCASCGNPTSTSSTSSCPYPGHRTLSPKVQTQTTYTYSDSTNCPTSTTNTFSSCPYPKACSSGGTCVDDCKRSNTCKKNERCGEDQDCENPIDETLICYGTSDKRCRTCTSVNECIKGDICKNNGDCIGELVCTSGICTEKGATPPCNEGTRTLTCTNTTNLRSTGPNCPTLNTNCAASSKICENGACVNPPPATITSITCNSALTQKTTTYSNGTSTQENCNSNQYCKPGIENGCVIKLEDNTPCNKDQECKSESSCKIFSHGSFCSNELIECLIDENCINSTDKCISGDCVHACSPYDPGLYCSGDTPCERKVENRQCVSTCDSPCSVSCSNGLCSNDPIPLIPTPIPGCIEGGGAGVPAC